MPTPNTDMTAGYALPKGFTVDPVTGRTQFNGVAGQRRNLQAFRANHAAEVAQTQPKVNPQAPFLIPPPVETKYTTPKGFKVDSKGHTRLISPGSP